MVKKAKIKTRSSLGKGLSALFSSTVSDLHDFSAKQNKQSDNVKRKKKASNEIDALGEYKEIDISKISLGNYQPRQVIDDIELEELVQSIKYNGVIVPIIVKWDVNLGQYVLIAGERRLKAAKKLGLNKIPAIVKDFSDREAFEIAIIENLLRKELNPIEEGAAYLKLVKDFDITIDELAQKLGKSKTYVELKIRLTNLPKPIQNALILNEITESHARILTTIHSEEAMMAIFKIIIRDKLNAKSTEELVRQIKLDSRDKVDLGKARNFEWFKRFARLREDLSTMIGSEVLLKKHKRGGGSIIIRFSDDDELEHIYRKIRGRN